MNATDTFGLHELGRATVDGTAYVVYSDGAYADAVPAYEYDDVPGRYEEDRYTVEPARGDEGWRVADCGERIGPVYADRVTAQDARDDLAHRWSGQRYSLWCSEQAPAVGDRALLSRILAAADVARVCSGACGVVDAADEPLCPTCGSSGVVDSDDGGTEPCPDCE